VIYITGPCAENRVAGRKKFSVVLWCLCGSVLLGRLTDSESEPLAPDLPSAQPRENQRSHDQKTWRSDMGVDPDNWACVGWNFEAVHNVLLMVTPATVHCGLTVLTNEQVAHGCLQPAGNRLRNPVRAAGSQVAAEVAVAIGQAF